MVLACCHFTGYALAMSQDDTNSGSPHRGRQEPTPGDKRVEPVKQSSLQNTEEERISTQTPRSSPAVRSAAWFVVILMVVLLAGWAIIYLLRAVMSN